MSNETIDVEVNDQGSIILLTPRTERAKEWFKENIQAEPWQWFGASLSVDHHYADDLIQGLQSEGMNVN